MKEIERDILINVQMQTEKMYLYLNYNTLSNI